MQPIRGVDSSFRSRTSESQVRVLLALGITASNLLGVLIVGSLSLVVLPLPLLEQDRSVRTALVWYGVVATVVGLAIGAYYARRILSPVVGVLRPGSVITESAQHAVLEAPHRIFVVQAALWAAAATGSVGVNMFRDFGFSVAFGLIIGLAGWVTSALSYLLSERSLRPAARFVLSAGVPHRPYVRSVAHRTMFAWALGTGVIVIGMLLVGVTAITQPGEIQLKTLGWTMTVLALITLVVGGASSYVAAQATSEPIRTLRQAVVRVETGDLDAHVPIYDGTEVGLLQAGFNQMVDGLREREELRDLFGRHVGEVVARRALEGGVRLGGETRDVTVLFVDIIGSTAITQSRPPEDVVQLLNRFFDVVIDVVHQYDGWINKFEGDAALAVWGAPTDRDDRHTAALTTARVLGARLAVEVPDLAAGIGVSGGVVVAGNVGTAERFEYTVIGDPVNEASRLTGLAKGVEHRVLANQAVVEAARPEESARWVELEPITVRGRSEPTRIATPL